jgi:hypothetical protein
LVVEHLERIARTAIQRFPDIITEYVRERSGVYALYKDTTLYYVGLAKDLKSRIRGHLRDRHALAWNRFSVYLTQGDEHIKELESLVLRIASPQANRVGGNFHASRNLFRVFRRRIVEIQRRELADITGRKMQVDSGDRGLRLKRGEFDTIVCPAHVDGFEKEFIGRNRWYAIRLSNHVIPHLKYIALYVTSPLRQITHYGRIRAIKPWKNSGKYIVLLRGKARRLGPIDFSHKVSMQSIRLARIARLKSARTLAEAF